VNRKRLLDSFALLAYLNQEQGYARVKNHLASAQKSGNRLLMNEINIGEVYYILSRKRGRGKADYFLETLLPGLPITLITNDLKKIIEAARLKAEYPLSFADCFALSTAESEKAALITGDPEFQKVASRVEIEWILPY
jgi:predicted nucleic acid-binding protein